MSTFNVTDFLQLLTALACIHFAGAWAIRLRHWPMIISVMCVAVLSVVVYFVIRWKLLSPADINILASVRTLLMAVLIGAMPAAVRRSRRQP